MTTPTLLKNLERSLARLVEILRKDPNCQWTRKFETDLKDCRRLIDGESGYSEWNALASSIAHVFQGMGSFNDYAPSTYDPKTGRYSVIPGTEDFAPVAQDVFDLALKIRQK